MRVARGGLLASAVRPGRLGQVGHIPLDGPALGRGLRLAWPPQMDEAEDPFVVLESDRLASGVGAKDPRRAPVAGEASRVSTEEDRVDRAGGCVQIFLVLDRVAGQSGGGHDERRGAGELARRVRPGRCLEVRQRSRSEDPEAPRVGEIVVRSPAGAPRCFTEGSSRVAGCSVGQLPYEVLRGASYAGVKDRRRLARPRQAIGTLCHLRASVSTARLRVRTHIACASGAGAFSAAPRPSVSQPFHGTVTEALHVAHGL